METEGPFKLGAVVGQSINKPNRWNSVGFVHAGDEVAHLEMVHAGSDFETRQAAQEGAIAAARAVAKTLDPSETAASRRASLFAAAGKTV